MADTNTLPAPTTNGAARPNPAATRAVTVTPRVDVLETENEFLVLLDVPGATPDGVDVRFENGELTVHAKRPAAHPEKTRAAWEYDVTNYFRTFRLTEHVAADKIGADLRNGVLTLSLPKVEAVKPRRIAVRG